MDNKQILGQNIRNYRQLRGMTQTQLANALGCASSTVAMYETGKREPDMDTIEAIADIFNIRIRDLVPDRIATPEETLAYVKSLTQPHYHAAVSGFITSNGSDDYVRQVLSGMERLSEYDQKKLLDMARVMFPDAFPE